MTKLIFLFFFILQAAGNQSAERLRFQARVLACPEAFLSHKSPLRDYLQREWQNPSAENLLNSYAATEKSHWLNRRSDRRKLEQGLVWTMEFLERSLTPAEQKIFENLSLELLTKALGKLPEIQAFTNEISESTTATESSKPLTVSQAEKRMLQVYVQAVFVTFGKFIPTILTKKRKTKINYDRMNVILLAISEFGKEGETKEFSLYKIRRAIGEEFDPEEFLLCRT